MRYMDLFIDKGGILIKHRIFENGDCWDLYFNNFICNLENGNNIDKHSEWLIRELRILYMENIEPLKGKRTLNSVL